LQVMASEQVSVAQFDDAENGLSHSVSRLTEAGLGIRANYTDADQVLAQQGFAPGWGTAALAGGSPLVYLATLLIQRYRRRLRSDAAYARRRGAYTRALQAVRRAEQLPEPDRVASALAGALTTFVSDCCNAPAGLTRHETVTLLRDHSVRAGQIECVDQLLKRCEGLQYAGLDDAADGDLVDRTLQCIRALHKERLR
ncbi:MAG: hypothetical protein ACE5GE_08630, partial [Phycisphaerae bacterium]